METKVGIQFYVDGAAAVARDIKKIGKSLGSAMSLGDVAKGTLAFLGIRTSLRMLGQEAREFFSDTISQSPQATAELANVNGQFQAIKTTMQEGLLPFVNDFIKGLGVIASTAEKTRATIGDLAYSAKFMQDIDSQTRDLYELKMQKEGKNPWASYLGLPAPKRRGTAQFPEEYDAIHEQVTQMYSGSFNPPETDALKGYTTAQKEAQEQVTSLNDALDRQIFVQAQLSAGQENAAELMEYSISLEKAYGDDIETQTKLYERYEAGLVELAKIKEKIAKADTDKKLAADRAAAYRAMSQDLDKRSVDSFRIRQDLLDQEYAKYKEFVEDKSLLDRWYFEEKRKLDIEQAKVGDNAWAGWKAGVQELKDSLITAGEMGAEAAHTMHDSLTSELNDAVWEGKQLDDVLKNVLKSVGKMATQQLLSNLVTAGMGGLGSLFSGGTQYHASGTVLTHPISWMDGGTRHVAGEVPEAIVPLEQGPGGRLGLASATPNFVLNVTNSGTAKTVKTSTPKFNGKEWVISAVLDDLDHGGPLSERMGR